MSSSLSAGSTINILILRACGIWLAEPRFTVSMLKARQRPHRGLEKDIVLGVDTGLLQFLLIMGWGADGLSQSS